jgi:hypothetical protein
VSKNHVSIRSKWITYEDNYFINPVDEFRNEMATDGTHNKFFSGKWNRSRRLWELVEIRSSQVASHDNNTVSEVNYSALTVSQSTIIENLKEQSDELPSSLLNPERLPG